MMLILKNESEGTMYLFSYKLKDKSFYVEIYHNRAEVYNEGKRKVFHYYEDIGEIMAAYGLYDDLENLEVIK